MQFNARQLMRETRIQTDLTTSDALSTLLIEHLIEQGLDVPYETLARVIYIKDYAPFGKNYWNGGEQLDILLDDVDHHEDEALNELYHDRIQDFLFTGDERLKESDVLRRTLEDALRALYGGAHVTFARGPRDYDVYVIVDDTPREPITSLAHTSWQTIQDNYGEHDTPARLMPTSVKPGDVFQLNGRRETVSFPLVDTYGASATVPVDVTRVGKRNMPGITLAENTRVRVVKGPLDHRPSDIVTVEVTVGATNYLLQIPWFVFVERTERPEPESKGGVHP